MTDAPTKAVVERAITRTKRNALQQLAYGLLWPVFLVLWGPSTFVVVLTAINALIWFFLVRRLIRLRRSGGAVRALLDDPAQVQEIVSWPRKLPPNRMPVFIDIITKQGDTCSLLLDQKNPQEIANLLGALNRRSPDALLLIPKLPVTTTVA